MREKREKGRLPLPLTNDLVFRSVYGRDVPECKRALTAMLNLVLEREDDPIEELEYKNAITLSGIIEAKESSMDIKVSVRENELGDVEMQVRVDDFYAERALYYNVQLMTGMLKRGRKYSDIGQTFVVSLLKENLFRETGKVHTVFGYKELEENFLLTNVSLLHFLELAKIDRGKPVGEMSGLEQFGAYVLSVGVEGREALVAELLESGNEVIKMTHEILEELSEEDLMREAAEAREKWQYLQNTREYVAEKRGREAGKAEKARETAALMKAAGEDLQKIIAYTQLSTAEIEAL